jgi:hypothetical protein
MIFFYYNQTHTSIKVPTISPSHVFSYSYVFHILRIKELLKGRVAVGRPFPARERECPTCAAVCTIDPLWWRRTHKVRE